MKLNLTQLELNYSYHLKRHVKLIEAVPEDMGFEVFLEYIRENTERIKFYSRHIRLIKDPTFEPIYIKGQLLSLNDFVYSVNSSFFEDTDGYGFYVRDEYMSDIEIYASDVKEDAIRRDFNSVLWFEYR